MCRARIKATETKRQEGETKMNTYVFERFAEGDVLVVQASGTREAWSRLRKAFDNQVTLDNLRDHYSLRLADNLDAINR